MTLEMIEKEIDSTLDKISTLTDNMRADGLSKWGITELEGSIEWLRELRDMLGGSL